MSASLTPHPYGEHRTMDVSKYPAATDTWGHTAQLGVLS